MNVKNAGFNQNEEEKALKIILDFINNVNKKSIQFTKPIVTKQDKLDFIRKFSKITVSSICTELGIDRSNLYRNISSSYNVDLVYREIIKKIQEIL